MGTQYYERIRDLRTQKKLTQKQLAKMAEIAPGSLSAYEKGKQIPPVDAAARIAKALGVSIDWLFGYEVDTTAGAPKSLGDLLKALISVTDTGIPVRIESETDLACLKIQDKTLVNLFNKWAKLYRLYQDGDIDADMYISFLFQWIIELSNVPLPLKVSN